MRLTIKTEDSSYKIGDFLRACKAIDKLGQLEDIEDRFGIDLAKAVELCERANSQKAVYVKEKWGIGTLEIFDGLDVELFNHRLYENARGTYVSLDLNEYGKTWALTKEELEERK